MPLDRICRRPGRRPGLRQDRSRPNGI